MVRKFLALCSVCIALVIAASASFAQAPAPATPDLALEKHVLAVSEQLRCLVCQNQTIADSHADLAIDLRNQVREKIQQGMSDQDIYVYMVARYGDFVLYRPPLKNTTWLLWFGPFLFMVGGLVFLTLRLRNRPPIESDELSESDLHRSAELLKNESPAKDLL